MAHALPFEPVPAATRFALEVRDGLLSSGQKTLPSKYFYDQVGSLLFEAICMLPEYGLTAADARLLHAHAAGMIAPFSAGVAVAELGSGSGQKTRWILDALCRRQFTRYSPIEISSLALDRCRAELADIRGLEISPVESEYLGGLATITRAREPGRPLLVLFLGSTLGNFDPAPAQAFLASVRHLLQPGDGLLLGLDLVKAPELLLRAYDDPAGVTAAFNRNLLARMNRELGADFDLRRWRHQARYNVGERRIEMHLRSCVDQAVRIPAIPATISFRRGETIWTESSHKFHPAEIAALVARAGFQLHQQWQDPLWPFAETLCLADGPPAANEQPATGNG